MFLSLRHGPDIVREILEAQGRGEGAIAATDAVLRAKGSSLADDFPLFCAWNVGTKERAGTGGYPDAAKYPGIKAVGGLDDGTSGITSGLSSFAFAGDLGGTLKVALETDEARNGGVVVPLDGERAKLDEAQKLPAVASGRVLVVVAGITAKKTDAPFTVRLLPPDDGASTSSCGGGGGSDDGGCACALPRRRSSAAAGVVTLLLGMVVLAARRCRSRAERTVPALQE